MALPRPESDEANSRHALLQTVVRVSEPADSPRGELAADAGAQGRQTTSRSTNGHPIYDRCVVRVTRSECLRPVGTDWIPNGFL